MWHWVPVLGIQRDPTKMSLKEDVVHETLRSWRAYKTYAWGHDELKPLTKGYNNWYKEPLSISPIDAYSTLKVMGLDQEASEIEQYVTDSLDFDKEVFVKTFEMNIRVLGGLLSIYSFTTNEKVLHQAKDFADRLLPAFRSKTGLPHYYVNLKTGEVKGDTINVAEAGSCLLEMAILSYYLNDPTYYQTAKNATKQIYNRRSDLGLLGRDIHVETGEWTFKNSMVGAYVDSYFEYLYKTWWLFEDPELKKMWDSMFPQLHIYLSEEVGNNLWYGKADMETGKLANSTITLWDAYFPALLALSGDLERAKRTQESWNWLWEHTKYSPPNMITKLMKLPTLLIR